MSWQWASPLLLPRRQRLSGQDHAAQIERPCIREALKKHKQAGHPIVVCENGKVVWIPADEIVIEDDI